MWTGGGREGGQSVTFVTKGRNVSQGEPRAEPAVASCHHQVVCHQGSLQPCSWMHRPPFPKT